MKSIRKIGAAAGIAMFALATPALAEGDAANGEKVFRKCMACHTVEEGKNKVGPSLYGVIGRTAGTVDGYRYSDLNHAASEHGLVWTEENIMTYLEDPQAFLEGYLSEAGAETPGRTKMNFKLRKEDERADVIAYLKSVGG